MIGHNETLQRMRLANPATTADAAELDNVLSVIEEMRASSPLPTRRRRTRPRRRAIASPWYRRPAATVVLAALGVFAVITPIALIIGADDSIVAVNETTVTPTTVTPTTVTLTTADTAVTAAPSVVPPLLRWVRVEDQDTFTAAGLQSVVVGGPGLIAVGQAAELVEGASPDDGTSEDAAVWVSTDGTIWERIIDPSFAGEPETDCREFFVGSQEMTGVAAGPLGVVAVGRDACSSAVWFSEDGLTWTEAIADDWRSNPLAVQAVTAGGPGWVAVGGDGRGNGGVWVSSNGLDWTAVSDDDLLWDDQRVDLFDVSVGGPGLVAVGISGVQGSRNEQSVIFVSADGLEWDRASTDAVGGAGLYRVSHDPATGRLITFSRPDAVTPHHVAWVSTDGLHWTSSESTAPPANNSVTWNGERLIATGPGWKSTYLSLWASTDNGNTWIDISDDAAFDPSHEAVDVTTIDNRVVIVGADPEGPNYSEAAIWIGEWTTE
jgi:hypothetical protein